MYKRRFVGLRDSTRLSADDQVIALTSEELRAGLSAEAMTLPYHLAATQDLPAAEIVVNVPAYRGHSFLRRLAADTSASAVSVEQPVKWIAGKTKELNGIARTLQSTNWTIKGVNKTNLTVEATPPRSHCEVDPRSFPLVFRGERLSLASDWGVFSQGKPDSGTMDLMNRVVEMHPVANVLDVGTGCGIIAVGLVACGWSKSALVTDIDAVALRLAKINLDRAGIRADLLLDADPPLQEGVFTVCNFPTHLNRSDSQRLLGSLVRQSKTAPVVFVVHSSLESRFMRAVEALGGRASVLTSNTHSVLQMGHELV